MHRLAAGLRDNRRPPGSELAGYQSNQFTNIADLADFTGAEAETECLFDRQKQSDVAHAVPPFDASRIEFGRRNETVLVEDITQNGGQFRINLISGWFRHGDTKFESKILKIGCRRQDYHQKRYLASADQTSHNASFRKNELTPQIELRIIR